MNSVLWALIAANAGVIVGVALEEDELLKKVRKFRRANGWIGLLSKGN